MNKNTVFPLRLEKTYYDNGLFNVRRAFDHLVTSDNGPISLQLGRGGPVIEGSVSRDAQSNGTARIFGGARLRNWFQQNYAMGDTVTVRFDTPSHLVIG